MSLARKEKKEIIKPLTPEEQIQQIEAEVTQKFYAEYKELSRKHKRDFRAVPSIEIFKL